MTDIGAPPQETAKYPDGHSPADPYLAENPGYSSGSLLPEAPLSLFDRRETDSGGGYSVSRRA
jgi:hypothetical protein